MTIALTLYRAGSALCAGLIARRDARRLELQGVAPERRSERLGQPTQPRPSGQLVWVNAVSVGETLSALTLIQALMDQGAHVLLTTTTASSAEMAARRLPAGAIHQFAPLDTPGPVTRFLDHWEPNLAIFIESDIWPRQIRATQSRGTPLALVNARLSKTSIRNWKLVGASAKRIISRFDRIYAQTDTTAQALTPFARDDVQPEVTGDLKAMAAPLPVDAVRLRALQDHIGDRPVWGALSTHEGEEATALSAHKAALAQQPDLLLILAPRHPERADALEDQMQADGWQVARRSKGAAVTPETQVYLADTLGEMGLWFTLSRTAFIGASLVPRGGHNPFEAVPFGTPVIAGPHRTNFEAAYAQMQASGAATLLPDATAASFTDALTRSLDPAQNAAQSRAMAEFPLGSPDIIRDIAAQLLSLINRRQE